MSLVSDKDQCSFVNDKGKVHAIAKLVNKLYCTLFSLNGIQYALSELTIVTITSINVTHLCVSNCQSRCDQNIFYISENSFVSLSNKVESVVSSFMPL